MARHFHLKTGLLVTLLAVLPGLPAQARDVGNFGPVWPIEEPDFLAEIIGRLKAMEADGGLAKMEKEMQDRTRAYVERPRGTDTLPTVQQARSFTVDLSIRLDQDLSDQNGVVFAAAGTVVNPLAHSAFRKTILFIDGDDPAQVDWAIGQGDETNSLIVLARGAPLELMRKHGRRFWFDQDGIMIGRFQIAALPSRVTRADPVMLVEEVPVTRKAAP